MEIDCKSLNCTLKKEIEHGRYLLKVYPELIAAFTRTGDTPITLELVEATYPKDHAETQFTYTVKDIGWKKWIDPGVKLLLLLFLLWYLWGVTGGKRRFKKNQVVTYAPIRKGKIKRDDERDYYLRKHIPWWDMFIPYRSQRTRVEDLKFIALRNRQIYLAKRSQDMVLHNGLSIDEAGRKDMRLNPGDILKTDYALYTIL
jgi:hypothetical protein